MNPTLAILAAFSVASISAASAAVTVTNDSGSTTTVDSGADQTNKTTTYSSWSLNGGNTVAVFFSAEGQDLSSATFGGQSMTIIHDTSGERWDAAVAYLINPSVTTGDIVLSWVETPTGDDGQNEIGYTPFALGGVGGVANSAANDNGSNLNFSYTTSLAGGYVLGAATNNSFNASSVPSYSGDNFDTVEYNSNISGNFSVLHVHGDVATVGSFSETLNNSESAAAIAFNPIPEPGIGLLSGLGVLGLLRRRRA